MQNMDLFGDAMHICNIGDCEWNSYVFPNKLGREYFEKIMQQLGVQYENS